MTMALLGCLVAAAVAKNHDHGREKRQLGSTPTCAQPLYTGVTSESSPPGTFILNAVATSNVGSSVTWSLQDTTLQKFVISPSGAVSIAGSLQRSAMQRSALEFRIRATDNSNGLVCRNLLIDLLYYYLLKWKTEHSKIKALLFFCIV